MGRNESAHKTVRVDLIVYNDCFVMNRILLEGGLEPPHLAALPPQSSVSTNSTIRAGVYVGQVRKTGSFVKEMNFLLSLALTIR